MFRRLKHWEIKNHSLYNLMQDRNIDVSEIAKLAGVNRRTVLRWIFEGATPIPSNIKKIESILDYVGLF